MPQYIDSYTWTEVNNYTWNDVSSYEWSPYIYDRYFLLKSENVYYTIVNNLLVPLSITELTASNFITYGFGNAPMASTLMQLDDPEIYIWNPYEQKRTVSMVTGVPNPQKVTTSTIYYDDATIYGVDGIEVGYLGDVLLRFSIDNAPYKYYHNGSWVQAGDLDGTSPSVIEELGRNAWNSLISGGSTMKAQAILSSNDDKLKFIKMIFLNDAPSLIMLPNEGE